MFVPKLKKLKPYKFIMKFLKKAPNPPNNIWVKQSCHHGHKWIGLSPDLRLLVCVVIAAELRIIHQDSVQTGVRSLTCPLAVGEISFLFLFLSVCVQEFTATLLPKPSSPHFILLTPSPHHTFILRSVFNGIYSSLLLKMLAIVCLFL